MQRVENIDKNKHNHSPCNACASLSYIITFRAKAGSAELGINSIPSHLAIGRLGNTLYSLDVGTARGNGKMAA